MTNLKEKLASRAEKIIADLQDISTRGKAPGGTITQFHVHDVGTRITNLVHSTLGSKSGYAELVRNALKQKSSISQLNALAGVVLAFERDLHDDNLVNIRHEVEAVVVSEILTQARRLAGSKGIHPAAAVVVACAGAEEFLRNWCSEKGISIPEKSRSIAKFAAELKASGLLALPEERRVTSWADYRNEAAHGSWANITVEIANRVVREIEEFVLEHREILG